jgi:hypothetical protein
MHVGFETAHAPAENPAHIDPESIHPEKNAASPHRKNAK